MKDASFGRRWDAIGGASESGYSGTARVGGKIRTGFRLGGSEGVSLPTHRLVTGKCWVHFGDFLKKTRIGGPQRVFSRCHFCPWVGGRILTRRETVIRGECCHKPMACIALRSNWLQTKTRGAIAWLDADTRDTEAEILLLFPSTGQLRSQFALKRP